MSTISLAYRRTFGTPRAGGMERATGRLDDHPVAFAHRSIPYILGPA
jgi:hypothetical protein